jgi:hypothetical protein
MPEGKKKILDFFLKNLINPRQQANHGGWRQIAAMESLARR